MKANIREYVEAYVAARRIERQVARHDIEWSRWVRRVELARRLGNVVLVQAASHQALLHGEKAAQLRMAQVEQEAAVRRLALLAQAERHSGLRND